MTRTLLARIERGRSPLALAALLLAAGCRLPEAFTHGLFTQSEPRPTPTAADCERCHQEVYREWESSPHAHAFENEAFQRASAEGRVTACVGCHAAGPIRADVRPEQRALYHAEGVTCLTCHQSPDPHASPLTMRGPISRTSPIEIHPIIEADPLYRSSGLCGACHEAELREWSATAQAAGDGETETCQGCHMPKVRRKMESVHDEHAYSALFVALGETRDLRRHTFDVPDVEPEQIGLAVRLSPDARSLEVSVENKLPHALPTGSFGRRELRLRAHWPGGEATRTRSRRLDGAIASGDTWRVRIPLPEGAAADAAVELERWDAASGAWKPLRRAAAEPAPS